MLSALENMTGVATGDLNESLVTIGNNKIKVKIGEYKVSEIKNFRKDNRWREILDIIPVHGKFKNCDTIYKITEAVESMGDTDLRCIELGTDRKLVYNTARFSSFKIKSIDDLEAVYALYDYNNNYDFISVPEEFVDYNNLKNFYILYDNTISKLDEIDDSYLFVDDKRIRKSNLSDYKILFYVKPVNSQHQITSPSDAVGRICFYKRDGKLAVCTGFSYGLGAIIYEISLLKYPDVTNTKDTGRSTNAWSSECVWLDFVSNDIIEEFNSKPRVLDTIVIDAKSGNEIVLENDSIINANNKACIEVSRQSEITIRSKDKKVCLTLNGDSQQPCIGLSTHTGMSYGRWSDKGESILEEIILDNIDLVMNSKVPNFSIGSYNNKNYPKITLINDATIVGCPEIEGERILAVKAFPPNGSTKIYDNPKYVIKKPGSSDEDLLSGELKDLRDEISRYDSKYYSLIKVDTIDKNVKAAIELLKLNKDLDVTKLLENKNSSINYIIECAIIIGCTDIISNVEFTFESNKTEYLINKYKKYYDETLDNTL